MVPIFEYVLEYLVDVFTIWSVDELVELIWVCRHANINNEEKPQKCFKVNLINQIHRQLARNQQANIQAMGVKRQPLLSSQNACSRTSIQKSEILSKHSLTATLNPEL